MPQRKKIAYIISTIDKSLAFEWIALGLKSDYVLTFILLNPATSVLEEFLIRNNVEVKRILYRGKKDFIAAFCKTFLYLLFNRKQVVHAHLFDAQLIGLTCAYLVGIRKRIYTRHNSNYHHVYRPQGVWFDRWSNRMATHIISISQATDKTLFELERVRINKVVTIPHGFDLDVFTEVSPERTQHIRKKWKIQKQNPVIGIIARHVEWKGIQFIIPAFQKFLIEYPTSFLVLANATGPYHDTIIKLLESIPVDRVVLIQFEEDVAALYTVFDLYIHTPVDSICEAFGQTYVEALAASRPSIFTLSGIANEFIVHERNALVVGFKDSTDIYHAMVRLWRHPELKRQLIENGRQDVFSRFGVAPMLASLKKLYES